MNTNFLPQDLNNDGVVTEAEQILFDAGVRKTVRIATPSAVFHTGASFHAVPGPVTHIESFPQVVIHRPEVSFVIADLDDTHPADFNGDGFVTDAELRAYNAGVRKPGHF